MKPYKCPRRNQTLDSPAKPFFPYFGGKSRVARKLACMMPKHDTYVEPFAGGGSVFFAKNLAKKNVINDLNKDIAKVYSAAKNRPSTIINCKIRNNKTAFFKAKNKHSKNTCDSLQIYHTSYGAQGSSYAKHDRPHGIRSTINPTQIDKLRNAVVTNEDFKNILKEYNKKDTLVYADPPYVKEGSAYHIHGVTPEEVCNELKKFKGKIMLSYDIHKNVRKACKGFKFKKISFPYTGGYGSGNRGVRSEYLITNY